MIDASAPPSAVIPPEKPQARAASGERRFVTVLFADLVGFTPYSENRDAEEVRDLLTRYFDRARDIVQRFGGVVDKFIGDAVMAVWGAENIQEDDAERGVRAALELVDAVNALGEDLGIEGLKARVGLMSGETSVGPGGNEKGLVVGDLVNTASRLQSIAEPGAVLVGTATRDLASAGIEFEDLGTHEVKGKSDSVQAWKARRVIAGVGGSRKSGGLVAPFVGRDQEMRLLKDLLDTTGKEGRVRMISVIGEGGTGKTRLIDEFWQYIDGVIADIYWHVGNSPSYGEGLTFWALGEMVRRRCGIVETDDDHRTVTKLRTALAEYVADQDDRAWMEPRLSALLGLTALTTSDRADLFGAWRSFFQQVSIRGTTVMVFEDIHLADKGLLDFIDEFASLGSNYPVLLITLARPELLERSPGWGSGRANSVSIWLGPLANADMSVLISGMVPGVSSDLVERLVNKAGGIPLYGVELVRMLHNRGAIVGGDGEFRVAEDVTRLDVPDSLHGVVGARIDQLDKPDRELLQDASVLGQSFTVRALAALRNEDEAGLIGRLDPFVRSSLLRIENDPRSPERGQYQFVQSLIREVAHARLTRAERRRRHLEVAQYFEHMDDPELAAAVASHYAAALEASPDGSEAEEIASRATTALTAAAQRAADLHSHEQAVSLCRQAMAISRDPLSIGRLQVMAAESAHALLDDTEAEQWARSAMQAFEQAGDTDGALLAATSLARMLNDSRRGASAAEVLEPQISGPTIESPAFARAAAELCRAFMFLRRQDEALDLGERASALAERFNLVPVVTDLFITRGTLLATRGRAREGMALLRAGLDLAESNELSRSIKRALNNLAYFGVADDWRASSEFTLRSHEYARRVGEPFGLILAGLDRFNDAIERGDWDLAETYQAELEMDRLQETNKSIVERLLLIKRIWTGEVDQVIKEFDAFLQKAARVSAESAEIDIELTHLSALAQFFMGHAEESFQVALTLDDDTPNLSDVDLALYCAMYLRDPEKMEQVAGLFASKTYRGERVDLLNMAIEGASSVLAGDKGRGVPLLQEAIRRADIYASPIQAAMLTALSAHLLGTDTDVGAELGRRAYQICVERRLPAIIDLVPEAMIADSAVVAWSS